MAKIRVGLVGCGHMGRYHAAKLAANPQVEFVGCHDVDYDRAEKLAREHGCRQIVSLEDFVGLVDAVSVAVPTKDHFHCAMPLLAAGVAVLVEKPLAANVSQAEKMVAEARRLGVVLQVGHSERFSPVYRAARNRIKEPRFIETHRLAPHKGRGDDVSVIYDLMIHDLDLILDMIGSPPVGIEAAGAAIITDRFDIVNARLTFAAGCVANVTASRISFREMRKLRIFQKEGYLSLDLANRQLDSFVVVDSDADDANSAAALRITLTNGRVMLKEDVSILPDDPLQSEIDSFIEAVKGVHPPVVSGESGLAALRLAEEIENRCLAFQTTL